MCEASVSDSDWISVTDWECRQTSWTNTRAVLECYSSFLNNNKFYKEKVRVLLLCGDDLLESFLIPNLWTKDDIQTILEEFGICCIERNGLDINKIIDENEILRKNKDRIHIVPPRIENNISSTAIRDHLSKGLSIKYLIPDKALEYIVLHNLYSGSDSNSNTTTSTNTNTNTNVSNNKSNSNGSSKRHQERLFPASHSHGKT